MALEIPAVGKYSPIIGGIELIDTSNKHYFTINDTSVTISVTYAVDTDIIERTIFKYRINNGSWITFSYNNYQSSHTFTGVNLSQGDVIEGRITVKIGNTYTDYPRVPAVREVVPKEGITDIKLLRRDFNTILLNKGFSIHIVSMDIELINCSCFSSEFGRPDAYCQTCDGTGIEGGYDNAYTVRAIVQETVPYALHGDANIYTKVGIADRADMTIFVAFDANVKIGDKVFYKHYRWKLMNKFSVPISGAFIFHECELAREFGLEETEK